MKDRPLDWIALSYDMITIDFNFFLISLTIYPIEEHILKPQDQKYGSRQRGEWMLWHFLREQGEQ